MVSKSKLTASLEDYLEAIFWIASKKGAARAKDIAKVLGVKAGSVTGALQALAERDFVNYAPYEQITLTAEGLEAAKQVIRRHEILKDFFVRILGVNEDIAEEGACILEHGIPEQVVERLLGFTEFLQSCPRCSGDLIERFQANCHKDERANCRACLKASLDNLEKRSDELAEIVMLTLADVEPGRMCVVRAMSNKASSTRRLVEMGVGCGTVIEVERVAPLGDPVEVKVRGFHLSLRNEEAVNIEVELR